MFQKPTLLLSFVLLLEICGACPSSCVCKWKNGKQTVECINKDLLVIPEGMDSGTQVLDFTGNNLRTLHKEKFLKMDLINLQRIYISRCRISSVDNGAFKGLTNLVELDLSGNLLDAVPTDSFADSPSLMRLILSFNPIKMIKKSAFDKLTYLNTLELNGCEITRIEDGAFRGLHSMEWIQLKSNRLTALNGSRMFPDVLRGVELQGNPWECDCHMLEMHAWLQEFTISQSSEPTCKGPVKLAGKAIKSIRVADLACLPDVSPTTFYLEIGEGKNVSLLCHVNSIPEAQVSWWFQGQLLQNDSLVAPGMRLIYYIEEGKVEKRSELFIYNTNPDDNGTFICTAENSAGVVYSNFTIRVVLKEEPRRDVATLPYEFVLITMSAAGISLLILILIMILSILKCHRSARLKRKRETDKMHTTKDSLLQESGDDFSEQSKDDSNFTLADRQQIILYSTHTEDVQRAMPVIPTNQICTPTASLRRYQLEQNPDLINDTETVGKRKEGDGESHVKIDEGMECSTKLISRTSIAEQLCTRDFYRLSADVHLNPVGLLNTSDPPRSCYRTLPYNRAGKRQSAANPISRFSREAEFLSRSNQPAAYEHYSPDVRYTADGYPVRTVEQETTFSESSVHSCCSMQPVQWPSCVSANVVRMNPNCKDNAVGKKCVGAQTQTDNNDTEINVSKPLNKSLCNIVKTNEFTESTDEGYEGDSVETNSNPC